MKCFYHTRHIPREHLKLSDPIGKAVEHNGLCDVLDEPMISKMREYNIDVIETRVVWCEIEKEEGVLNFSPLRERVEKIKQAGFKVGVFPWFQHPPEWIKGVTRLKCLEHGEESTLISLWDPALLKSYDRLYGALAKEFAGDIDFLYVGVYGDFGEVFYPHGVTHYMFSSPHGHRGLYCGDESARADWKKYLEDKYKTVDKISEAWGSQIKAFDEDLMNFDISDNLNKRLDFAAWYTSSLMNFTEEVCKIVRKYFPNVRAALPIGQRREPLEFGQIKSIAAKIAGRYNMAVRWTSIADFGKDFAHSNICSRRISSAAKFYGAGFGGEASLYLDGETAGAVIYEMIANNMQILHNDPGNIVRGGEVYNKFRSFNKSMDYICDTAVFYPLEAELASRVIKGKNSPKQDASYDDKDRARGMAEDLINMPFFYDKLAELRAYTDYEICDSIMIKDGFLKNINTLIIMSDCRLLKECASCIEKFREKGLRVCYIGEKLPVIFETNETFDCEKISFGDLGKNDGRYYTRHQNCISEFEPKTNEIKFADVRNVH